MKKKVNVRTLAVKKGYRSGLEDNMSQFLQEKNIEFTYEKEKLKFKEPAKERTYTPDFVLIKKDETKMYIETKGYWPASERKKMKWVKEDNPNLDIRIVFMNPNTKITKKSKTTYADVATKMGYKWTKFSNDLPEEWLSEIK